MFAVLVSTSLCVCVIRLRIAISSAFLSDVSVDIAVAFLDILLALVVTLAFISSIESITRVLHWLFSSFSPGTKGYIRFLSSSYIESTVALDCMKRFVNAFISQFHHFAGRVQPTLVPSA